MPFHSQWCLYFSNMKVFVNEWKWKKPRAGFLEVVDLFIGIVTDFSHQSQTFFTILFLPFCRGEKIVQHTWNSLWDVLKWLNGSIYTAKNRPLKYSKMWHFSLLLGYLSPINRRYGMFSIAHFFSAFQTLSSGILYEKILWSPLTEFQRTFWG
jgi:hypothetical protein